MEFGLIGEKLGHSYSVPIHQALAEYEYVLCPLDRKELDPFLRKKDFKGLNVTIPYKQAVLPYLDGVSPEAEDVGSVNTIVKQKDGRLLGYNTDLYGMEYMTRLLGVPLRGKKVLVLGSGGTSLTARAMLRRQGAAQVLVVSRSGPLTYEGLEAHRDAQILINTTPVGMYPGNGASPVDLERFPQLEGVLDVIYNPRHTALLLQAERLGIAHAGGLEMLVAQAKRACELFTGKQLPEELIPQVAAKLRASMLNLVLIGMPGSGKTQIGLCAAALLGRRALDADEEIVRRAGMSIPDFFARHGEEAFRRLETEVLGDFGKLSATVIATGGGVVTRSENRDLLRQNGVLVHVRRPLEELNTEGRPLSKDMESLRRMERERMPLYRRFADAQIDNTETILQAAEAAVEAFYEAIGDQRP